MLVLIIAYSLVFSFLPRLSDQTTLFLHFGHALSWCIFHCFGLGLLLRAQSKSKFLVRHFMKNYHYPSGDGGKGAIVEAFTNWKVVYNLSLCMTYGACSVLCSLRMGDVRDWMYELTGSFVYYEVSFIGVVWKTYSIPNDWTVGNELLRHTLGVVCVPLPLLYALA